MQEGIKKFEELLKNDSAFQEKLKAAMESYNGEQTEEAVFEGVLAPLAQEYGISATLEEVKAYMAGISMDEERELDDDEIDQIAGGKGRWGGGLGFTKCSIVGFGVGAGAGENGGTACAGIGVGKGQHECLVVGDSDSFDF